jgi:hypothetical protein
MAPEIIKVIPVTEPVLGQKYFCISCKLGGLTIVEDIFSEDSVDRMRYNHYNMFKSFADAAIILKEINNVFEKLGDNT